MTVSFLPKIKVQLSHLLADKLAVTIDIPSEYRSYIVKQLKEAGAVYWKKSRYRLTYRSIETAKPVDHLSADQSGDTVLLLQADPKADKYNFLRIEYNPAKIDRVLLPLAVGDFLPYPLTFSGIMKGARVTRIDLAVDATGAGMDNLLVCSLHKRVSETINNGGKTLYLGRKDSQSCLRIYDKGHLISKKNSAKCQLLKEPQPLGPVTRIELVLQPKNMSFSDLLAIPNPFADIQVFHVPESFAMADPLFRQTLAVARLDNLQRALGNLPPKDRVRFLKRIEHCEANWWNSEAVWAQFPALVDWLISAGGKGKATGEGG
jgi:hypothetical protein